MNLITGIKNKLCYLCNKSPTRIWRQDFAEFEPKIYFRVYLSRTCYESSRTCYESSNLGWQELNRKYSESPRIKTYFFENQAEIGSYFKDSNINFTV